MQSVKGMASFLLAAHSKMQEKTKRLKEELLRKMEPAPDDLRFQPLLIAKRAKSRRFMSRKHVLGRKPMVSLENCMYTVPWKGQTVSGFWLHKRLSEEMQQETHGFPQPSWQKPGTRDYLRKICGRASRSME